MRFPLACIVVMTPAIRPAPKYSFDRMQLALPRVDAQGEQKP